MKKRRLHPLQALAPFLVSWWTSHRTMFTWAKMWMLWDALDEIERKARDDRK